MEVLCIGKEYSCPLTVGKFYKVIFDFDYGYSYQLEKDDEGKSSFYPREWFQGALK